MANFFVAIVLGGLLSLHKRCEKKTSRLKGRRPSDGLLWTHHRIGKKVKEGDLFSAFLLQYLTPKTLRYRSLCYLQITPYLPLPCKHSPDGASPD